MFKFRNYQEAHTEWTTFFLKFVETILSFTCMLYHLEAILDTDEPMPHNMLFCATFGGYFILGLSGFLVPVSGQLSPPGVDMVFAIIAFILFFSSASVAMYYVAEDPHLKDDKMTDPEEANHPFFIHCKMHCIVSLINGTFYMMHAAISADRLASVRHGLSEEEADIADSELEDVIVDILPETPITLHLFVLDWLFYLWDTKCMQAWRRCCSCKCRRKRRRSSATKRKKRIDPHQKAYLLAQRASLPGTSTLNLQTENKKARFFNNI